MARDASSRWHTGETLPVGFNPYRKFKASAADYVLVVTALLVTLALVAWAVVG